MKVPVVVTRSHSCITASAMSQRSLVQNSYEGLSSVMAHRSSSTS